MNIMDRYIAWKFSCLFLLWCLFFIMFYTIIDLFSNFDSFVGKTDLLTTVSIIAKYYLAHSFPLLDMISPFLFLISAITMLKSMDQGNEIIALMANGVSRLRIMVPLLVTAFIFSLLFFVVRETIVPWNMKEIIRKPEDYFMKDESVSVKQMKDNISEIRLGGERAIARHQEIEKPVLTFPTGFTMYGTKLTAKKAVSLPANEKHPTGWLLQEVIQPVELLKDKSLTNAATGKECIITPNDRPDFLKSNECFFVSELPFEILEIGDPWVSYASTPNLIRAINNPSLQFSKLDLWSRVHTRILRPFLDILPFFLCLPLIFFRNSKKMTRDIFICVFITFMYIGIQYMSSYFVSGYDPILAAWLPILIILPLAACVFNELVIAPRVLLTNKKVS